MLLRKAFRIRCNKCNAIMCHYGQKRLTHSFHVHYSIFSRIYPIFFFYFLLITIFIILRRWVSALSSCPTCQSLRSPQPSVFSCAAWRFALKFEDGGPQTGREELRFLLVGFPFEFSPCISNWLIITTICQIHRILKL